MSSSTSKVAITPARRPIGPNIIQVINTGADICIGLPAANIRIQMYLPMKVSMTKKCNHARIIICSVENNSTTISGVGMSDANVIRTLPMFGSKRMKYEAINGNMQIFRFPTILRVMSCFGRNHIRTHIGNMNEEENQKVIDTKSITLPRY